ncbi:MAG: hypothetical protein Fur006_09490 [Coleofasciculaceae cyanobacterium]
MTYKAQLYPWCIIRPFPNMRVQIVGRFRNRSDAEGHLQILKRLMPNVPYQIMFDIPPEDSENLTPPNLPALPEDGKAKLSCSISLFEGKRESRGTGRKVNPME